MRILPLLIGAAALLAPMAVPALCAAAEPSPTVATFRLKVGEASIVALSDGVFPLPADQLLIADRPGVVEPLLQKAGLPAAPETTVNAFLIEVGGRRILVDTGSGALLGPSLGGLAASLKAAGYAPDQIDEILITHLHPDHVGGLTADGGAVFPNATVRVDKADADYWLDKAHQASADASVKGAFDGAAASLAPYIAAGRFKPFEPGQALSPGLTALSTPGHTPGHASYRLVSKGQTIVFWGDIVHVAAVQFPDPAVTIHFDTDPTQAAATRKALYEQAGGNHALVAASHIAFPGVGRVSQVGKTFIWSPVSNVGR